MKNSTDQSSVAQKPSEDRNAMAFAALLAWAWSETPPVHRNTANLLIHIFAVPLFVAGHFLLVAGIVINPRLLIAAALCIVVSLVLQKIGHSLERNQVPPFTGARDFLRRLYAEQFCNFWRFLFSGQWYASFKANKTN
ncbi:MAG TPA: hypothetical protein VI566_06080 [Xanthomonadales bacterium]|nr:hypothetical protein [Xanthomonadales bacterium]